MYAIQQRFYHVGKGWDEWSIDFDRTFDDRELAEKSIEDDNLSDTAQYRVVEINKNKTTMANENEKQERKYITGETFDQVCARYRAMMKANEGKSWEEQRDAINKFRCGY